MFASPPVSAAQSRVLVVDDDHLSRLIISETLRSQHYEVTVAESVQMARQIIEESGIDSFDVLITDYTMPGENGLALLEWVKSRDPSLACIVVTANGEKQLVADSLHRGVYDYHEKPMAASALLPSVSRAVGMTLRQRHLRAAELAVRDVARLQHALVHMQSEGPENRVDLCYVPKQQAGGDYVSIFPLGPGQFMVLATDVSGHDLRAAFAASYFQGIARGMMECHAPIDQVFAFFNNFLVLEWNRPRHWQGGSQIDTSLAACAIHVDVAGKTARVINCGFPVPLRIGNGCHASDLVDTGSAPLGWFAKAEPVSASINLTDGMAISLWSDGLEELAAQLGVDPHAIAYSLHRARRLGVPPPAFLAEARDDVMAVLIDVGTVPVAGGQTLQLLLRQSYPGDSTAQIDRYQELWHRSLALACPTLAEDRIYNIIICAREALLNALDFGCKGRSDLSASLTLAVDQHAGVLTLRLSDPGPGHDFVEPADEPAAADLPVRQRGLVLIRHFSDGMTSERRGADLIMQFTLHPPVVPLDPAYHEI